MRSLTAWARYERLLLAAMTAPDPVRVLRAGARDRRLDADLRRRLARVDEDGVRMAALLVARLRFERLLRGAPEAEAWYDQDPASFTLAFRRYHHEVAPVAFFPRGEMKLWRAWCKRRASH